MLPDLDQLIHSVGRSIAYWLMLSYRYVGQAYNYIVCWSIIIILYIYLEVIA